jgi:hypothetical protein
MRIAGFDGRGGGGAKGVQYACDCPPSIGTTAPLMYGCLLRQQEGHKGRHFVGLTEAPHRVDAHELGAGVLPTSLARDLDEEPLTISVTIAPGAMALIDTPELAVLDRALPPGSPLLATSARTGDAGPTDRRRPPRRAFRDCRRQLRDARLTTDAGLTDQLGDWSRALLLHA